MNRIFIALFSLSTLLFSQSNEDCMMCHSDDELTTDRAGKEISLLVEPDIISTSVHTGMECVDCHTDADVEDFPHDEDLERVQCSMCHDEINDEFEQGIHGIALDRNLLYAPRCTECHGQHDILSPKNPKSPSYKMNIPFLCGKCHREGAPVARIYNITEHNIIENYSQSIHGEGLFKKGLTVTASCTDCHSSHKVLPHTDPKSSISPGNVAATCMTCHSRIAEVHQQVIEGERWQSAPGSIPACTDCHLPHRARKESMVLTLSDRACLKCHNDLNLSKTVDGESVSLYVDRSRLSTSAHKTVTCVKCHSDVNPKLHRPCSTAAEVKCSSCHTSAGQGYEISGHGTAFMAGHENAPSCTTCHDYHETKPRADESSPIFRTAIPELCGRCHGEDNKAGKKDHALTDYSTSVHGRSMVEKGLLPSAVCTDCHNSHMINGMIIRNHRIIINNVPATCSTCHHGIYE